MKKTIATVLTALLLTLAACSGGKEPAPTAEPGNTAEPGSTEARPTPDSARQAFNPETDYDNRCGALIHGSMIETDDAYYLYNESYLMYYDKVMEESGYLCPKPECVHGEKQNNVGCNAYANVAPGSLVYREGQLWWVGDTDFRHFAIFRMNLDGTGKELVHEFEYTGDSRGMVRFYLHRDHLFYVRSDQVVKHGEAFDTATFGCFDLDNYEKHILAVRKSYFNPQPGMYFAGDSAYLFVSYDGVTEDSTDIPSQHYEYEEWLKWRNQIKTKDEILRWDPSMDEPETIYLNAEDGIGWGYNSYFVAEDGTVWFVDEDFLEGEYTGLDGFILYICTIGADGKKERVLTLIDEDGMHYTPIVMSCGVVFAVNYEYERGLIKDVKAWVLTLDGETVYRGELPTAYREKYTNIKRHGLDGFYSSWATEDELLIRFEEGYDSLGPYGSDMCYYDFVKYEITPDGLVEIPLCHCRDHFASNDDTVPDFGD